MIYNEEVENLLNQVENIISKEYDESISKLTTEYELEIVRLNAVIDAYREVAIKAQKDADKLEEINEKLSQRLSWKCECTGCFQVK